MAELTSEGLAKYCEKCLTLKVTYLKGGLMRIITNKYLAQLQKLYPSWYTTSRMEHYKPFVEEGFYGADCVGLIKSYIMGGLGSPKYTSPKDMSTTGMYNTAQEKGDISTLPEIRGIILYMDGHVGVYVGNDNVIECTWGSLGNGIIKSKLSQRRWTHWLKMKYIKYPDITNTVDTEIVKYVVQQGDSLWKIAEKFLGNGSRYTDIMAWNSLKNTMIYPNQVLIVKETQKVKDITYQVKKGDTLWGIAKRFYGNGSLFPLIVEKNKLKDPANIYPGQILVIPNRG